MSAARFTPGPWRYSFDGHGGIRIESIEWQIGYVSSAGGRQEANARLIAAAPDLLKELQSTADYLRSACLVIADANGRRMALDQVDRALAVIAKATGEQP